MAIKKPYPLQKRKSARNFTFKTAQKRLDETVAPFNTQVNNSLKVDSVSIDYYAKNYSGVPCSCEWHVSDSVKEIKKPPDNVQKNDPHITIDTRERIFGEHPTDDYEDQIDSSFDIITENETRYSRGLFSSGSMDCGICYRTGLVPGFTPFNNQRIVATHHFIHDADGYHIDKTKNPYAMEKLRKDAYIDFVISIPKYWKKCFYSVRNNHQLLETSLYTIHNFPLTAQELRKYSGKQLIIRIKEKIFTHLIMEFDPGVEKFTANLSGESVVLDYTLLETMGNLQIVLPPTLCKVSPEDIIVIKSRNLVLKITDVNRYQTADRKLLEWQATGRVLQPQESLRNIQKLLPLD